MPRVIVAYGTRPEWVKLVPVVDALRERGVEVMEWSSGQSRDLVAASHDVAWGTELWSGIAATMGAITRELSRTTVDAVVVQGDTATAFACAQAAFLARVPVAHVEAGLRTYAAEPWPEEAFRRQIAAVARWHFAPDEEAAQNLCRELGLGYRDMPTPLNVYVTGNTVIDTLPKVPFRVLVTLHRRENWGERIRSALAELGAFAGSSDSYIVCIRHPNYPRAVGCPEEDFLPLTFVDPVQHDALIELLADHTYDVIVTDSGGLQEEAAHFGVPCLVLRTRTERVALERCGAVSIVDPDDPNALRSALDAELAKRRCYGAGDASVRIADILVRELTNDASA